MGRQDSREAGQSAAPHAIPPLDGHLSLYNRLHIASLDTETHLACGLLGT
jgi:hypothetical protein